MPVSLVAVLTEFHTNTGAHSVDIAIDELDTWTNPDGPFVAPTTISWTSGNVTSVAR